MTEGGAQFLPDPIDFAVLRTILTTMEQGALPAGVRYAVVEMQVMLEEAERSLRPEAWDAKIRERWAALEQEVRASRVAAGPTG